ncbi:response regulator transcription factor [Candidatus Margulisiibacteriota bacterium]
MPSDLNRSSKILLIEENPETAKLILEILIPNDLVPITAMDSTTAIDMAKSDKPDLILFDIMAREKDGCNVCKQLREDSEISDVPMIVLYERGSEDFKKRGIELGCVDCVAKPFVIKELLGTVKKNLNRKHNLPHPGQ